MSATSQLYLRAGTVDVGRRELVRDGTAVALSTRELALLLYLAERPGQPVSRTELLTEVWGYRATVETRAIDVTMRRLREKVEVNPAEPDHLLTRHGDGYLFAPGQAGPAPAPTGPEIAVVFTDIEGSTAQWERLGEAYQAVIDQHAALIRRAVNDHRGYEVKTAGDGFMVAFARAEDALRACLDIQRLLASADFGDLPAPSVRIGAHLGPATARPDPLTGRVDWFGTTINRAARVAASAHGGQVVVTEAVRASARVDAAWTDLGEHAFSGIGGTLRVWQVLPPELAHRRFPALASLPRARLPAPIDRFVGREAELADLRDRFARGVRLVTLLGPGGTGKTRLALEHARTCSAPSAWFCNLVEATDAEDICRALASCAGKALGDSPADQLGQVLAHHGAGRWILDNADQVAEPLAALLKRWMAAAPKATFVVTSRVALRLAGEDLLATGPLAAADAVALFVERARAAGVALDPLDPDVVGLVDALDAWPLALELAAARTRALPLAALRVKLGDRFRVLVGGSGERRHVSLRTVVRGSWDALAEDERAALAQLSTFAGGFTLDAAEAVLDGDSLGLLAALVDNALLRLDHGSGRYSMLLTIREFAAEMLEGDARAAAEHRHGAFFAATRSAPDDLDNLVAATSRATARGDLDVAAACATQAATMFEERGPFTEGLRVVLPVLARAPDRWRPGLELHAGTLMALSGLVDDAAPLLHAATRHAATSAPAFVVLGRLARERGQGAEALLHLEAAVTAAAASGQGEVEAAAYTNMGDVYVQVGRPADARRCLDRAVALARAAGSTPELARAYASLCLVHSWYSRPAEATRAFDQTRATLAAAGDPTLDATVHLNLALFSMEHGWLEDAEAAGQVCLSLKRAAGHKRGAALALTVLGYIAVIDGRLAAARARLEESVRVQREVRDQRLECYSLGFVGLLELAEGAPAKAVTVLHEAVALARAIRDPMMVATSLGFLAQAQVDAGRPADARASVDEAVATLVPGARPYACAWVWVAKAAVERAAGDRAALDEALARTRSLVAEIDIGGASDVGRRLASVEDPRR